LHTLDLQNRRSWKFRFIS